MAERLGNHNLLVTELPPKSHRSSQVDMSDLHELFAWCISFGSGDMLVEDGLRAGFSLNLPSFVINSPSYHVATVSLVDF